VKYPKRQGNPGAHYETNDPRAGTVQLDADADGVVDIKTEDEARAADAFGLPVARKPKAPSPVPLESPED
jgi:hypothetical protein